MNNWNECVNTIEAIEEIHNKRLVQVKNLSKIANQVAELNADCINAIAKSDTVMSEAINIDCPNERERDELIKRINQIALEQHETEKILIDTVATISPMLKKQ